MSAPAFVGAPMPLERRGAPAIAAAFSAAVHAALLSVSFKGWEARTPAPPTLVAARDALALSVEPPPRARRAAPDDPAPAPRPVVRAVERAVERVEAPERTISPRPAVTRDAPPEPSPVARAADATASVALPEPRVLTGLSPSAPGGVMTPRLVSGEAKPEYPPACREARHRPRGCEGTGRYEVEVAATGDVVSAETAESAGCPHLDRAAVLFLLRRARFEPAAIDGLAVPWKGRLSVTFRLEEAGPLASGSAGAGPRAGRADE